jgi:DNA-binding PadR family transcriptional regulator
MRPDLEKEVEILHGINPRDALLEARRAAQAFGRGFDRSGFGPFAPSQDGGGRRRGRLFGQGELRLLLLKLLAETPRHGYQLIKAIEELTGGAYAPSPGTVYPTLQLLADEGAIAERQDEDSPRKAYAATAQGKDELHAREAEARALFERLAGIAEERRSAPNLQIHRAMENLRNALRMQRHRNALQGAMVDAMVDLIDETARRIERM